MKLSGLGREFFEHRAYMMKLSRQKLAVCLILIAPLVFADSVDQAEKALHSSEGYYYLREMQTYSIEALGLRIGVENQPPWTVNLMQQGQQSIFTAQSPADYHPSSAMTFTSFKKEKVSESQLFAVASTAIERASLNFGLTEAQASTLIKKSAKYGVLNGYESTFHTKLQGVPVDVKVFVGQAKGKYPVALSIYTTAGNMPMLKEVIRRSWGNLTYL